MGMGLEIQEEEGKKEIKRTKKVKLQANVSKYEMS